MAFLVDDLFLLPFRGIKMVGEHVKTAAEEHLEQEKQEIMVQLADLHRQLERGEIEEKEFDQREAEFLDRRDQIEKILHPDPPLTKRQRMEKHFPEEFEQERREPEEEPTFLEDELNSIREHRLGELVTDIESQSRLGFASIRDKPGAIKPAGIEPTSVEREASGLQPTKLKPVGLGPSKQEVESEPEPEGETASKTKAELKRKAAAFWDSWRKEVR